MKTMMIVIGLMVSLNSFAADGSWVVLSREKDIGYHKPVQLTEVKMWLRTGEKRFLCVNENWIYAYSRQSLLIIAPDGFNQETLKLENDNIADEFLNFITRVGQTFEQARISGGNNFSESELANIPEVPMTGVEVAGFKCH